MTKEEMIELAREAGFERLGHTAEDWVCHLEDIEEFTKLVAKRTWVGLTDEEREEIALEVPMDAIRITEAKLKEKNT